MTRKSLLENDNLITILVAVVAFAVFSQFSLHGMGKHITLVGAERVLAGQVPYRDFWTMYAPGQFYLLAGLFALFGTNVLVNAVAGTLFGAATVGLCYPLVARMTGSRTYALVSAVLFTAVFLGFGYFDSIQSYMPTMFFILVAFVFFERHLADDSDGALIGAGLAAGCAALFKHDVGAYVALAMLAGLLVFRLIPGGAMPQRHPLRAPLFLGIAAAAPVLPVVLALAAVAGRDAFQDTIWFPLTIFPDVRGEQYPSLIPPGFDYPSMVKLFQAWVGYFVFALPFLIWLASLPATAACAWRGRRKPAALGTAFAVAFLFHYSAAHVQINTHIVSMSFYALCLAALFLTELTRGRVGRAGSAPAMIAAVAAIGWIVLLVARPVYVKLDPARPVMATLNLPKAGSARMPRDQARALEALAKFVWAHVPPGEGFYAGPDRHDIVIIGEPLLYFLFDRLPPTRYHEPHPGIADTAPVQKEMIRDLKSTNVKLVILSHRFADDWLDRLKRLKQLKRPEIGATALDAFIRANYVQSERFGAYSVWLRK